MPRGGFRENAGRKSGWSNTETQVIRVPKSLAPQLIEIAKKLDSGMHLDFVIESNSGSFDSITKSIKEVVSKWHRMSNSSTPKNTRWDKARQILDELEAVLCGSIVFDSVAESKTIPGQMNLLESITEPVQGSIGGESIDVFSLPISELGRRWSQTTPSITRAKREKSRQEFIEYSKKKEELLGNDFGWEYLLDINRFGPVDISPENFQKLKDQYP